MASRESTDLRALGVVHNGHVGPENNLMAFTADLADGHQRLGRYGYLEDA